jgi:hypothetical protein
VVPILGYPVESGSGWEKDRKRVEKKVSPAINDVSFITQVLLVLPVYRCDKENVIKKPVLF